MSNLFELRPKQVEFGMFYHGFLARMGRKYGLDYSQRYLVDLSKLTDRELITFSKLYAEMMAARGVATSTIEKTLSNISK